MRSVITTILQALRRTSRSLLLVERASTRRSYLRSATRQHPLSVLAGPDPSMIELADWPMFDDDVAWDLAQEALTSAGLSDGLPLVPPTPTRMAAMLNGIKEPATSHGVMPPLFRELNAVVVAYNCVLAGCLPGAAPVVLTAATACLEPSFNLLGLATTTGAPAVATIVHGPAARTLAMNDGVNCLAPGNRANATLGRAIALVLRNVAGMCTGEGDMATMGQPAKYGLCFPEGSDPTFPALHVRRGLNASESAVTVLGISGTAEVLPSVDTGNWDTPEVILDPVTLMMQTTLIAGGGARKPDGNEHVLLLPPELAALIAKRGWTVDAIERHLYHRINASDRGSIVNSPRDILVIVTGGPGVKMTVLPQWGGGTRSVTRRL